jgi:4-hydroxy-tetrahydrodipicolinate reductase
MKIALFGYGKMGKIIENLAIKNGDEIVFVKTSKIHRGTLEEAAVAVDFSTPNTAFENIKVCLEKGIPVISGTTGWLEKYEEICAICQKNKGAFLYGSNFSVGVNIFFKINAYAAKLIGKHKNYNVRIQEIHHTQKLDAPSGTAITLAQQIIPFSVKKDWVLNKTEPSKITIDAIRKEDVKGTHKIIYESDQDSILLEHKANTREGFAQGALLAASWIIGKKGIFTMEDVLNLAED